MTGMPRSSAALMPTRSARRTIRGLRAPYACAASGVTAAISPEPDHECGESNAAWPSDAAATA